MLFGNMEYGLRMNVLKKLTLSFHTHIHSVYQITILNSHDLVIEVHENNFFGVVLNAEFAFYIVHDIIDSVEFSGFDLFIAKVDFQAPKNEALLIFFGFFKKDIDDVLDWGRDGQELLFAANCIAFLELLLYQVKVLNVINFIVGVVKNSQKNVFQETYESYSFLYL